MFLKERTYFRILEQFPLNWPENNCHWQRAHRCEILPIVAFHNIQNLVCNKVKKGPGLIISNYSQIKLIYDTTELWKHFAAFHTLHKHLSVKVFGLTTSVSSQRCWFAHTPKPIFDLHIAFSMSCAAVRRLKTLRPPTSNEGNSEPSTSSEPSWKKRYPPVISHNPTFGWPHVSQYDNYLTAT